MKEYRINGFEQIKAFYSWVFNNPDKARPTHVSLYLFLLNQANRANWAEWFKCPYDLAMQGACIGNNGTYYKCLDELKEWKLIDYHKGVNNYKAPLIHLFCLYESEQQTEQVTVPLSEQQTEQQTVQLTEQVTVHIYNVLTNNIKRITDNIDEIIIFLDSKEKKKYIYSQFYDREIELSMNDENYIEVIKVLYGKNDYEKPLNVLLKMPTQLSYKQFLKIWGLKKEYGIIISKVFEEIENWGNHKKNTTIYGTFLTFIKNENKNIKLK